MNTHSAFILAAYALTFCVVAGMIAAIVIDHAALRQALAKFPARSEDRPAGDSPTDDA